jgi:hypothetical protein
LLELEEPDPDDELEPDEPEEVELDELDVELEPPPPPQPNSPHAKSRIRHIDTVIKNCRRLNRSGKKHTTANIMVDGLLIEDEAGLVVDTVTARFTDATLEKFTDAGCTEQVAYSGTPVQANWTTAAKPGDAVTEIG